MDTTQPTNPRYAGLDQVHHTGYSVEMAGNYIRRLAHTEEQLMRLYASRVILLPQREVKLLFARMQYESGLHADGLKTRATELRVSKNRLKASPDPSLTLVFDEANFLPGTYPFISILAELLLPNLIKSYQEYLHTTNHVADYPSTRIIRQNLGEVKEHQTLLRQILANYVPTESDISESDAWKDHIQKYILAAGGIIGNLDSKTNLHPIFSKTPFKLEHTIQRDQSFEHVWDYVKPSKDETDLYLNYMMAIRLSEINVAEGLGFVLLETEEMPWSFYLDISRHLWDEMRHSIFGEVAIENTFGDRRTLPMREYEGVYAYGADPLEQYATLGLEIEGANMKYPPGKRWEWEFCRDQAQHPLMTTFQDYDWADEILHVNIARRQLDEWFDGGLKAIASFSRIGKQHRDEIKTRYPQVLIQPKE